jgi:hypothetical protein
MEDQLIVPVIFTEAVVVEEQERLEATGSLMRGLVVLVDHHQ